MMILSNFLKTYLVLYLNKNVLSSRKRKAMIDFFPILQSTGSVVLFTIHKVNLVSILLQIFEYLCALAKPAFNIIKECVLFSLKNSFYGKGK